MIVDTNWVIRCRKSKDMQYNGQKKNDKKTNSDLQNTKQKPKDWTTPHKTGMNLGVSKGLDVPAPLVVPIVFH